MIYSKIGCIKVEELKLISKVMMRDPSFLGPVYRRWLYIHFEVVETDQDLTWIEALWEGEGNGNSARGFAFYWLSSAKSA